MQKAHGDIANHVRTESESAEGTTLAEGEEEDNASTRGMVSPGGSAVSATSPISAIGPEVNGNGNANENGIPTIRISTESDRDKDSGAPSTATAADTLERPVQAAAGDDEADVTGAEKDAKKAKEPASPLPQEPFSFSNKRLCERWLDNLFMVLYEVPSFFLSLLSLQLTVH